MAELSLKRRLIQLASALIYNANLSGFVSGKIYTGGSKGVCVPGLNCYSCPGAVGSCPLGALQNAIANTPNKAPFYIAGAIMMIGLLLGRAVCGFLCPFGLLQELLHKLPTPKIKKSPLTRTLSRSKYVILAVFVLALPLWFAFSSGLPMPAFCKYICPAGTLEGGIPLVLLNKGLRKAIGVLFYRKTLICAAMIILSVFIYRVFCRFICPLGAIYSLFAGVALVAVRVDQTKCNGCGSCVRQCQMDVKQVGDHECIHCGQCISSCPQKCIYFIKKGTKQ